MFVHLRPAQERDPSVPELDEVLDREADAAIVLGLEPRERRVGRRPARDHDRHRRYLEQREPRIVELRIGQQEPVDAAGGSVARTRPVRLQPLWRAPRFSQSVMEVLAVRTCASPRHGCVGRLVRESRYLQGIDTEEIIAAVRSRRGPMMSPSPTAAERRATP
jgi:hypothetical protein